MNINIASNYFIDMFKLLLNTFFRLYTPKIIRNKIKFTHWINNYLLKCIHYENELKLCIANKNDFNHTKHTKYDIGLF